MVQKLLVRIINECLAFFIEDSARLARLPVDSHDPHQLMAALVVQEGESLRVLLPADFTNPPRVGKQLVTHRNVLAIDNVEQLRFT